MNSRGDGSSFNHDDHNDQMSSPLESLFTSSIARISLLFIAAAMACFVLYDSVYPNQYLSITLPNPLSSVIPSRGSTITNQTSLFRNFSDSRDEFLQGDYDGKSKLDRVLNEAAMENKTVIIATLNAAWIAPNSIFDLFLESFRIGNGTQNLLCHVVVIALDQNAYSRCLELHPHCYALSTEGVDFSGAANFMTEDYLKIGWKRIEFLQTVLRMGYSFILSDVDILWFRDPFSHFHGDADIQISSDHYGHNSTDSENIANAGFYYVKSNKQTIKFYDFWYKSKDDKLPGRHHDQTVFNMIRQDERLMNKIGVKIKFLDTAFYGGFCEPSKDLNVVCTMHANCCTGLENKIHDLTMALEDWKKYMASPSEEKLTHPLRWTVPQLCRV